MTPPNGSGKSANSWAHVPVHHPVRFPGRLGWPLMKVIREAGFDVICDVSDGTTVDQWPDLGLVVQSRVHVDGYGMRHTPHIYRGFFDVDKVFDHRHRLARWGHHHL